MEDSFVDGYFIREYSLIKMGTPESTFSSLFFPSLPTCVSTLTNHTTRLFLARAERGAGSSLSLGQEAGVWAS